MWKRRRWTLSFLSSEPSLGTLPDAGESWEPLLEPVPEPPEKRDISGKQNQTYADEKPPLEEGKDQPGQTQDQ